VFSVPATNHILVLSASALSGYASEFAEMVLEHRNLGPQTYEFVRVC